MSNDINYREYQMKKMQYQIKRTKLALIMMFIAAICFAICAYGSICIMRKYKSYSEELEQKVSEMQDELNSAKTNETAMETAYMSLKYEMESQEETPTEEVSEEAEPTQEEVEEIISTYVSSDPYTPTNLTADQFNSIITSVCESYGRSTSGFIYSGYGQALVDTETTYGVNGLVILGIAQAESGLNTSDNAWATNNATSICKNGKLVYYSSPYESIMATGNLLSKYHNKGCNTIYDIGSIYFPVNPNWASTVQSYIDRFVSYAG